VYAADQLVLNMDGLPCVLENKLLYNALLTLPDKERRVILYDFWYDLKDKEISEKLEVTVRTVYNLRQRAFKKIRTYYELHGQGPDP
jgi:DNA-directed RNA polymerase specialized sigma24 family protein